MKELKIASVQEQYHELEAPLPVGLVPAAADHELEAPLPVGLLPVGLVLPAAEAKHALSVSGI